eukprot:m.349774 g.349774  ORF g.349774 m.349774 type:complete len:377 (-) comp27955_c2_seq7:253-1383(-)
MSRDSCSDQGVVECCPEEVMSEPRRRVQPAQHAAAGGRGMVVASRQPHRTKPLPPGFPLVPPRDPRGSSHDSRQPPTAKALTKRPHHPPVTNPTTRPTPTAATATAIKGTQKIKKKKKKKTVALKDDPAAPAKAPASWDTLRHDDEAVRTVYGFGPEAGLVQPRGTSRTLPGRVLAWPNTLQHCVAPFELADPTQCGHRTIVCFFLVDPTVRVRSSATVPPQAREWYEKEVRAVLLQTPLKALELRDLVITFLGDLGGLMTYAQAAERRARLMEERTAAKRDPQELIVPEMYAARKTTMNGKTKCNRDATPLHMQLSLWRCSVELAEHTGAVCQNKHSCWCRSPPLVFVTNHYLGLRGCGVSRFSSLVAATKCTKG